MKLGMIADIHGNHLALQATLDFLRPRVDQIYFAGDVAGYYPFVHECLELLDHNKIISVRGNHDQCLIDLWTSKKPNPNYENKYGNALERALYSINQNDIALIHSWPLFKQTTFAEIKIYLVHGSPADLLNGRVYPDFTDWGQFQDIQTDLIIMGHTHYPMIKRIQSKLLINPGSVGQPRNQHGPYAQCAEIDLATLEVLHHQINYNADEIIRDAKINQIGKLDFAKYFKTDNLV